MAPALIFSFFYTLCSAILQQNRPVTLVFAGDAMQHQAQLNAAYKGKGEYDYSECFAKLAPYIHKADLAVVNLETTLGEKNFTGYPCFSSPDTFADALHDAGFDIFLTANNHTLDRSDSGLRRTIEVLDKKGYAHLGTYRDSSHRAESVPFIVKVKGIHIGMLNYTYGTNGLKARNGAIVNYIDKDQIRKDIQLTRKGGAEIVCVAIHWGEEYQLLPNAQQCQLADFLENEGVDLIIGGHPHVIQPMEIREKPSGEKSLIVYSLGNFISNMRTADTRGGALVKAYLSRDVKGKAKLDSAAYSLVFTVPPGASNFHLVDADSCTDITWTNHCNIFANRAKGIFRTHNKGVGQELKTCTSMY